MNHDPLRSTPFEKRHKDGDDDGGAPYEDTRYGRFRRPLRRQDGQVEADHPDGRQEGEPSPLAARQPPQDGGRASPQPEQQEQARHSVADELTTGVRIVAEQAVGGEGAPDEEAGEGREQRPT